MKESILMTTKFKQADHVLGSNLDDAMIVTSTESEAFYGMNKVASFIWKMLESPISAEETVSHLLERFKVEKSTCEQEVKVFFNEMKQADIIQQLS